MVISPFSLQRLYITGELKIVQGRSVSIREETKFTGSGTRLRHCRPIPWFSLDTETFPRSLKDCSLTRTMRNPMDIEVFRYEKWERNLKHVKENTLFDEK